MITTKYIPVCRFKTGYYSYFYQESYEDKLSKHLWMQHAFSMHNKVKGSKNYSAAILITLLHTMEIKKSYLKIFTIFVRSSGAYADLKMGQERKRKNMILRILFTNNIYEAPVNFYFLLFSFLQLVSLR